MCSVKNVCFSATAFAFEKKNKEKKKEREKKRARHYISECCKTNAKPTQNQRKTTTTSTYLAHLNRFNILLVIRPK